MKIVEYVGEDKGRMAELMGIFLGDVYRLSQRASWAINNCSQHRPELIKPYFGKLIDQLERDDSHDAVRRNVARMLQFVEVPSRYRGRVFDACYNLVDDPKQPIAVRVFAMSSAARIAENESELLNELRLVVKKHLLGSSAAYRSRARRLLQVI